MDKRNDNIRHLDLLALDALREGEGTAEEWAHLLECEPCRNALDRLSSLAEALRKTQPPAAPASPSVDRAVMEAYRRRFMATGAPTTRDRRWLIPAFGAAAAVLLAALVLPQFHQEAPRQAAEMKQAPSAMTAFAPAGGDVNGDGRLDILDAFALARSVKAGTAGAGFDATGDGLVDNFDVDALARRAVAL